MLLGEVRITLPSLGEQGCLLCDLEEGPINGLLRMQCIGIGIDVVNINRFVNIVVQNNCAAFIKKTLTVAEQQELAAHVPHLISHADRAISGKEARFAASFMASRFSIKESIYKAFYPTEVLHWHDITITKCPKGQKPIAFFARDSLQSNYSCQISMTHEKDNRLISTAIIFKNPILCG